MSDPGSKRQEAPVPTARREIWRWDTSGGEVAVIELQDYDGGRRVVAIRRWYRDRAGELRPGRTGISFPLSDLDDIENAIEALRVIVPRPPTPGEDPVEQHDQDDVVAEIQATPPTRRFPFPRLPLRRPEPVAPEVLARIASAGSATPATPMPSPVAPPVPQATTPTRRSALAAIFDMGLVAAPLALRLEVGGTVITGAAYADGSIVFGNRRFANPREAVSILRGQTHIVDGWHAIRYRNPKTQRFARLSRLRGLYQGLSEAAEMDTEDVGAAGD
jgi:hypothetical protein